MRNPRQMSLFDALEQPAATVPQPEPIAPAPARVKLSLDIGDTFLGYVEGYEFGDVCFWQRAVEGIGDGMMPTYCYLLVRFHADPEGKVYRKHVRSVDIERDMEWAIETTLFDEAQSFFYRFTGDARPRHLTKR